MTGTAADVPRVLFVTNDFPPRVGGVQQYVWNLVRNLPPDRVAVLAPNWPGWREHDAPQPFHVERWPAGFLWPTTDLARRVRSIARNHRADVLVFGHAFPSAAIATRLRGELPYVVLTHGAELWLGRVPAIRTAMRRVFAGASAVTAVSRFTGRRIASLVGDDVPLTVLYPGVDEERFSPDVHGSEVRERHRLDGSAVVLCVSRLVPRKGQDTLIRAMPIVRRSVRDAVLLIVGGGPYEQQLREMAAEAPPGSVVFAGEVPDEELPAHYAACDVFAMPCRSRWGGMEVEGFGIVYLEAAAAAKPVIAGRSGGADEAMVDDETGFLVEGREPKSVAVALRWLLQDRSLADRLGSAGRARVETSFTWRHQAERLARLLRRPVG